MVRPIQRRSIPPNEREHPSRGRRRGGAGGAARGGGDGIYWVGDGVFLRRLFVSREMRAGSLVETGRNGGGTREWSSATRDPSNSPLITMLYAATVNDAKILARAPVGSSHGIVVSPSELPGQRFTSILSARATDRPLPFRSPASIQSPSSSDRKAAVTSIVELVDYYIASTVGFQLAKRNPTKRRRAGGTSADGVRRAPPGGTSHASNTLVSTRVRPLASARGGGFAAVSRGAFSRHRPAGNCACAANTVF